MTLAVATFSSGIGEGLLASAVAGILAIAGGIILWWLNKRSAKDAWQKHADAIRNELRRVYEQRNAYQEGQIASKDAALDKKDAEIARLNRLLTGRRAGADDP